MIIVDAEEILSHKSGMQLQLHEYNKANICNLARLLFFFVQLMLDAQFPTNMHRRLVLYRIIVYKAKSDNMMDGKMMNDNLHYVKYRSKLPNIHY